MRKIAFIMAAALLLSGCAASGNKKAERAEALLEGRYNIDFDIAKVYPQHSSLWYTVLAADGAGTVFTADIDTKDDNFSDSYVERLVCGRVAGMASANLSGFPGRFYVFARGLGPQPITTDTGISVEGYMALNEYNDLRIELVISPDGNDYDAMYDAISGMMTGIGCGGVTAEVYAVDGKKLGEMESFFKERGSDFGMDFLKLTEDIETFEVDFDADGECLMDREGFAYPIKKALGEY